MSMPAFSTGRGAECEEAELVAPSLVCKGAGYKRHTRRQGLTMGKKALLWSKKCAIVTGSAESRFEQQGNARDINEAIELLREALTLHPPPHPSRGMSLNNSANTMETRFKQQGHAREMGPSNCIENRGMSLNNLANAVQSRFEQQGDARDIDEVIGLRREALTLCAPPHPDHGSFLNNLGYALRTRFEHIDEAIGFHQEAVALHATPHPNRGMSLNNLATAVWRRFSQQGNARDIDEAIALHREALALYAPPYTNQGMLLSNLAVAVMTRFEQQGDARDIDEAIGLHREALVLCAPPHPHRGGLLSNLATAVQTRFDQQRDPRDIDEAIKLNRGALALHIPPHPLCGVSLNNLADAVLTRFEHLEDSKDIDEAIELYREALALRAPPHPDHGASLNNLGDAVMSRFVQQGDPKDIDEAIEHLSEALALHVPPQPVRIISLRTLAKCLAAMYGHSKNSDYLNQACALFQEATLYLSSSPLARFNTAHSWARNAAKYAHTSALPAYHATITLLPQLAAFHLDPPSRQNILSTAQGSALASDAASCAVGLGQFHVAVEFLEASCAVFWSQALHLRTPLDGLAKVRPDLARRLTELSRQLEHASFRDTSRNLLTETQHKAISIESEGMHCRRLNEEWDQILRSVQILPGFKDFMRPKSIDALKLQFLVQSSFLPLPTLLALHSL
ncbi:hypothetical protein B0H13DRAFT_1902968 [Mycena leptocephala]|nr:hypothetical protein B0H13DRAFT_1902968 [Mycena leptocephala]